MAISDLLPGLDVSIKVNGQVLREYEGDDIEDEERTVTRYVEAVSGDTFEIELKVQQGFDFIGDALGFDIHIDGSEKLDGPLIRSKMCASGEHTRVSQGCRVPGNKVKLYHFAALQTCSFRAQFDMMRKLTLVIK